MKTCTKCGTEKAETEFAWKSKANGKRSPSCRACHNAYSKQHYLNNTEHYLVKAKSSRNTVVKANKVWLLEYLATHPCVDCGEADLDVLEFDHIELLRQPGKRIGYYLSSSRKVLEAEVAKCEIRCANCHTRRTRKQFGWER